MIWILITFLLIIVAFIGTVIALTVDWRGLFQKRFGDDYHRGEAVYIINGKRSYVPCELWHESPNAMSYWYRTVIDGQKVTMDYIVPTPKPNEGPLQFDANGRRMFWPIKGNVICANAEKVDYQFTNYPPEMMSSDIADRVGVEYGRSVTQKGGNGGMWLLIGIALIVILAGVFLYNGLKPKPAVPVNPPAAAANTTAPAPFPPGTVIGIPITPGPPGAK